MQLQAAADMNNSDDKFGTAHQPPVPRIPDGQPTNIRVPERADKHQRPGCWDETQTLSSTPAAQ